jgi:putative chitinase
MTSITPTLLHNLAHGGNPALIAALAPELQVQLPPSGIGTRLQLAHFLSQAACETWCFRRLDEDLCYSAEGIARQFPRLASRAAALAMNPQALGNAAYAARYGNGGEESGDGFRYRGRGLFCLTFRSNYEWIGPLVGRDLVSEPDLVLEPRWAIATAIAFWNARHIGEAADADDLARVTNLVNGGADGIVERMILKHRALALLREQAVGNGQ